MYIPKYFAAHELVPPSVYDALNGDERRIFNLFDDRQLRTDDMLRERYGPVTINNWKWGGNFKESGLRDPRTGTGAAWSQHKFGRGTDKKFDKVTAEEIRQDILANPNNEAFQFITCIEMGVSWLHTDCRNWDKNKNGILLIYP